MKAALHCPQVVDHELMMVEEICTNDSLLNIGNDENPSEAAPKTETDSEAASTVCGNAAAIDGPKRKLLLGGVTAIR